MDVRKSLGFLALAMFTLLAWYSSPAEACSCQPSHPQTHFCSADYVILIRVLRKSSVLVPFQDVYKVEVKRSYKMNDQSHNMLKNGRILTSQSDSLCGISLKINRLYIIAGRANQLNACSYVKEYKDMTHIERRGFSGVYRKGCKCQIQPCFGPACNRKHVSTDTCKWSPFAKCETDFSACVESSYKTPEGTITKCHWRRTPAYKACLKNP